MSDREASQPSLTSKLKKTRFQARAIFKILIFQLPTYFIVGRNEGLRRKQQTLMQDMIPTVFVQKKGFLHLESEIIHG